MWGWAMAGESQGLLISVLESDMFRAGLSCNMRITISVLTYPLCYGHFTAIVQLCHSFHNISTCFQVDTHLPQMLPSHCFPSGLVQAHGQAMESVSALCCSLGNKELHPCPSSFVLSTEDAERCPACGQLVEPYSVQRGKFQGTPLSRDRTCLVTSPR